ncbi:MAG: ribosome-associated translation inhibitor RaiA [Christensenellaceae bacterium]|jgi:putative sigma-54 modulation protein|nr:ribosome-associated translation inhibitor RaiA [Christensenellaceae bacterium]
MRLELISKGYKDDKAESFLQKKLARLDKFFSEDTYAKVKLSVNGNLFTTEVTIYQAGSTPPLRAEVSSHDMFDNIDLIIHKLERQIRKFKTRQEIKKTPKANTARDTKVVVENDEIENSKYGKIVRIKNFEISRISVDDAIAQLEMLDHSFYLFINSADDKVSLIYKRHDGDYGLITPVY